MSSESQSMKQPIRRLEIPINKFNDVAIPHYLDLLRRHKENMLKFQIMKDWEKVQKEQMNASRLVKQLEQLLYEMDTLRSQVDDNDIEKFDELTFKSRDSTIHAIQEYLGMKFEPLLQFIPLNDDINEFTPNHLFDEKLIQRQQEEDDIERQTACLHAWDSLQSDLHQLHQLFSDFNKLIHDKKEQVNRIEKEVIASDENIREGAKYLKQASKLKVAGYPLAGALIGTCIGGPVGLIAGLKLGGLAAFGCGVLGFTGATILKKKHLDSLRKTDQQQIRSDAKINRKSGAINDYLSIESKEEL